MLRTHQTSPGRWAIAGSRSLLLDAAATGSALKAGCLRRRVGDTIRTSQGATNTDVCVAVWTRHPLSLIVGEENTNRVFSVSSSAPRLRVARTFLGKILWPGNTQWRPRNTNRVFSSSVERLWGCAYVLTLVG
ncbi:hypothetical protein GGX14DRAFT_555377 [Mycena pura]|uniref:Uncharacterized protein n=1 Tax=Mycena pura TaxID=153505 RepID=A0AAD6YQW2_9AGAR|nr:hypothetical protein GGX14DRAFT_555377 [Mycena pura]